MSSTPRAGTPEHATGHVIRDSSLGLVPETLSALIELQGAVWHRTSVGPALNSAANQVAQQVAQWIGG